MASRWYCDLNLVNCNVNFGGIYLNLNASDRKIQTSKKERKKVKHERHEYSEEHDHASPNMAWSFFEFYINIDLFVAKEYSNDIDQVGFVLLILILFHNTYFWKSHSNSCTNCQYKHRISNKPYCFGEYLDSL